MELEVEGKCEEKTINNDNDKGKLKEDKDHVSGPSSTVAVSQKEAGFYQIQDILKSSQQIHCCSIDCGREYLSLEAACRNVLKLNCLQCFLKCSHQIQINAHVR